MNKVSKLLLSLLLLLTVLLAPVSAYAADTATVYIGQPIASVDNSLLYPVIIQNNPGLMGFKFHVEYSDGISVISVSEGSVTARGLLVENHASVNGEMDILWNYSEEIREDGTLFYIGVIAADPAREQITLSCSENDTFNGAFENVVVSCLEKELALPDSMEITVPQDVTQRSAFIDQIAQMIVLKNGHAPDISAVKETEKVKVAETLSDGAKALLATVPEEVKDEVLTSVYDQTLKAIQAEQAEEKSIPDTDRNAKLSGSRKVKAALPVCGIAVIMLLVLLILYMRKKK